MSSYTRPGWMDDDAPVENPGSCPKCQSSDYRVTIANDFCPDCGYGVNYRGGGMNEVARSFDIDRARQDRLDRREDR